MLHPKGVEILASKEKSGISVFYTFLVAQFIMVGIVVVIVRIMPFDLAAREVHCAVSYVIK